MGVDNALQGQISSALTKKTWWGTSVSEVEEIDG